VRTIWATHLAFVALYAAVAWDASDRVRDGGPFFTSAPFFLLFGAVPAVLAVVVPPRARLSADARGLLGWSLAEGPALTGVLSWLSGGGVVALGVGLGATAALLIALRPGEPARPTS
jgi:hypothetical protein